MNKINLLCMNVVFFTTSRVSELASIVAAIKFSKMSAGAQPWRGSSLSAPPPPPLQYSMPMTFMHQSMVSSIPTGFKSSTMRNLYQKSEQVTDALQ